jgi:hypothetical protein
MNLENIFLLIWALGLVGMLGFKLYKGSKALKLFPEVNETEFLYAENRVSGFCTSGSSWAHCQARRILRIRVTEDEFWLTAHAISAHYLMEQDMLKRIPFTNLISVKPFEKSVSIEYKVSSRVNSFEIITTANVELIELLNKKIVESK